MACDLRIASEDAILIKRLSNLAYQPDFRHAMNAYVPAQQACLASPEHQTAMAAFRAEQAAKGK